MRFPSHSTSLKARQGERGNILFMILLAVVLIGLLTAAILHSNRPEGASIDKESLVIRASEVQRAASEFERGVLFIIQQNGKSENEIRFAHPQADATYGNLAADTDKSDELFDKAGGAATYHAPPPDINDGSKWEFYGTTALPQVGTGKADLVAVLPNVTQAFCDKINEIDGESATQPTDDGDCIYSGASNRFNNATQFISVPNTTNDVSFTKKPALQACVKCADNSLHFYHVLLAR